VFNALEHVFIALEHVFIALEQKNVVVTEKNIAAAKLYIFLWPYRKVFVPLRRKKYR